MQNPYRPARQVFNACFRIESEEQLQAELDRQCGSNHELREEVQRLLDAAKSDDGFLESPPLDLVTLEVPFSTSGEEDEQAYAALDIDLNGKYRLLGKIGRGGFGEVYKAEQLFPVVRTVAIKVVRPGMDSKEVIARFNAERQALAIMNHPGIAKVLDAGQTESGRPYFVMELVDGVPVHQFCRHRKLTLTTKINLFCDICRAVHHAHQKGIIHRDLKPTNILVSQHEDGLHPKVIDFGIAKAMQQRLTNDSLNTKHGVMLGTPMYMSPEQTNVGNEDIDVRSDVYSLGIVLYELLTGRTPFDREQLQSSGLEGMRQLICEVDPPLPSNRVISSIHSTTEPNSGSEMNTARRLSHELKRELDWIVMKAIEKDRSRRYDSVNDLALDLQRHLAKEPVHAGPPSASYRLQKFAAKHLSALITAAILVACLLAATVVSTLFAYQANEAKRAAQVSESKKTTALEQARESKDNAIEQATIAKQEATRADQAATEANLARDQEKIARQQAEDSLYVSDIRYVFEKLQHDPTAVVLPSLLAQAPRPGSVPPNWEWNYLLTQRLQSDLRWQGSPSNVSNIAWSPDGDRIAATTWNGPGLKIWSSRTGELLQQFPGSPTIEYGVDWHPDGKRIAWGSASSDNTIRIWNETTNEIDQLHANSGSHRAVKFSPDGTRILLGTIADVDPPPAYDGTTIAIWKLEDGKWILEAKNQRKHFIRQAEWNHDGTMIAVSRGERASLISPATAQSIHWFEHVHAMSIAWHPQQNLIACGTRKGEVVLCDADARIELQRFEAHSGSVESLAWSPDGQWFATGGNDREVKIWNASNFELKTRYLGHDGPINQVAWHSNSQKLASCGKDGRINVWPLQPEPKRVEFQFYPLGQDTNPPLYDHRTDWANEQSLATLVSAGEFGIVDATTGETLSTTSIEPHAFWRTTSRELATRLLNVQSDHPSIQCAWIQGGESELFVIEPAKSIWHQAGNDKLIYHEAGYGKLMELNLKTKATRALGEGELILTSDVKWSPDRKMIAAFGRGLTSDDGTKAHYGWVHLFDAATGVALQRARVGYNRVHTYAGAWSPDSQQIVAGTEDGVCQVFDRLSLKSQTIASVHATRVTSLSWHPTGDRVASASLDRTVAVWNPDSGQVLIRFQLDAPMVHVDWSPDGSKLTASDHQGRIYVWDATRGYRLWKNQQVESLLIDRLSSQFQSAAFASDLHRAQKLGLEYFQRESPVNFQLGYVVALLSRVAGRNDDYQQICETLKQASSDKLTSDEMVAYFKCVALGLEEVDLDPMITEDVQQQLSTAEFGADGQLALSLLLFSQKRYSDALELLDPQLSESQPTVLGLSLAALIHSKLGDDPSANEMRRQATLLLESERFTAETWHVPVLAEWLLEKSKR